MIASLAFVAVFLAIGLLVVFTAARGGPRGAREALYGQSRRGRRLAFIGLPLVMLAFGAAIPAVVLNANSDNKAKDAPGGVKLTTAQARGREVFARNCSTCHTLGAANAVGRVGPDLDELRPPKELTLDAIENGRARGQGQMPAELIDGQDARDVADFIAAVAGR